jgi:hypothetical protein
MTPRTNQEWLTALRGRDPNPAALSDLRTDVLRAALFTLQRARHHVGHLAARCERWASVSLDGILEGTETLSATPAGRDGPADPERRALKQQRGQQHLEQVIHERGCSVVA